jgi:hypothetical protein
MMPSLSFMGFTVNIPVGGGEQIAMPNARAAGCTIHLDAVPTLLELLATTETYGVLKLSSLPGEATYLARVARRGDEVVIDVCPEHVERQMEILTPYEPTRLPVGLRALAADLLSDALGSVSTHPIPVVIRNVVATAAALLAEAVEKAEALGGHPHGAVSLREQGILMAGYLDLLTRALREPDAIPILPVEVERMDKTARRTCNSLWPLLHALEATLNGQTLVAPIGICNPPPDA